MSDNFAFELLQGASAGEKQLFFVARNLFGLPWQRQRITLPSTRGVRHLAFEENRDATRVLTRESCLISMPTGSQVAVNRRSLPEGSPNLAEVPCPTPTTYSPSSSRRSASPRRSPNSAGP